MTYSVYIVTNYHRTVFYTGVTNNLIRRILEHRDGKGKFTSAYKCYYLVYYEDHRYILNAIARESQIKNWKRQWKIELILKDNPGMRDLAEEWLGVFRPKD